MGLSEEAGALDRGPAQEARARPQTNALSVAGLFTTYTQTLSAVGDIHHIHGRGP